MDEDDPVGADVRRELYGGARAGFVERRTALAAAARQGGDRQVATAITRLRKPSTAAHAVNVLAHHDDPTLHEVFELGDATRAAMAAGDAELRSLFRRRSETIGSAVARARELMASEGSPISATIEEQVAQTLRAAMASPDLAEAVAEGALVDVLDEPDFAELPPVPASVKPVKRAGKRAAERAGKRAAERAGKRAGTRREPDRHGRDTAAEATVDAERRADADAAVAAAVAELERARRQRVELERRRDAVEAELAEIDAQLEPARTAESDAEQERALAEQARRGLGSS